MTLVPRYSVAPSLKSKLSRFSLLANLRFVSQASLPRIKKAPLKDVFLILAGPTGWRSEAAIPSVRVSKVNFFDSPSLRTSGSNHSASTVQKNTKPPRRRLNIFLAGPTGFEPAIFSVTGRRVRPATPRALVSKQLKLCLLICTLNAKCF